MPYWFIVFYCLRNSGSSTIGTYEKEETSQSSEKSESESHGGQVKENTESTTIDTLKTSGDAPHEGSGVEIKTGANVSVDTTNSKANSKP
ncbi:MAG: hypothetical protein JWQ09_36 [Segetibacter sp.]|nr:hypothetical protein [Segetibacter sp.]